MTSECENIQTLIIEKWATEQNLFVLGRQC